jgi:phosphocarrier protein HPr
MQEKEVIILNRAGIHARPAALIVQKANDFSANIFMEKDGNRINAKSIMGIITLGATHKSKIKIITEGDDEGPALDAIAALFENRFEEE